MKLKFVVLVVLVVVCGVRSAKILGVFNIASVSHQIVFQPIWRELSLRGHDVTVLTPNPLKDPSLTNLTEIDLSFLYAELEEMSPDFSLTMDHWQIIKMWPESLEKLTERMLSNPAVLSLINDTSKEFDVVLAEYITPPVKAFASRFNCPMIGVASLGIQDAIHREVGNPTHPIVYPEMLTSYGDELSFFERIDSVLYSIYLNYVYYHDMMPRCDKIVRKYFGNDLPYLGDLDKHLVMLFLNTNPVLHKPRPYGPNTIEMGRMHIKPKKPLPNDLQKFLDNATEGVIYFSLGSNVKSIHIDKEKRKFIMETFSELPYKVLWKFENDQMEGKPDNVKISKWLPQQDVLRHPNIKLFITQAGLQSTEEAIVNKVPVLGMPFIADQHYLAKRYKSLGIGLYLDFTTLTKEQFKNAILEITGNPKYKEKMVEVSDTITDEPNTGLERAVWWTEYVIRHRGAPYFKSPAVDMPSYQYYLLDVITFFLAIICLVLYTTFKLYNYAAKLFITGYKKTKTL